jgi:serine/threonine protein kinase
MPLNRMLSELDVLKKALQELQEAYYRDNIEVGRVLGEGGISIVKAGILQSGGEKIAIAERKSAPEYGLDAFANTDIVNAGATRIPKNPFLDMALYLSTTLPNGINPISRITRKAKGGTLLDWAYNQVVIQHAEISFEVFRQMLGQILLGIKALHDNGLAHCDIKEGNILVQPIKNIAGISAPLFIITDFDGVVSVDKNGIQLNKAEDPTFTMIYLPPPMLPVPWNHKRLDLYALGVSLRNLSSPCDKKDLPSLLAFKKDDEKMLHSAFIELLCQMDSATSCNPDFRGEKALTAEDCMDHIIFGATNRKRVAFFKELTAKYLPIAEQRRTVDNYYINEVQTNRFFLLPLKLKKITASVTDFINRASFIFQNADVSGKIPEKYIPSGYEKNLSNSISEIIKDIDALTFEGKNKNSSPEKIRILVLFRAAFSKVSTAAQKVVSAPRSSYTRFKATLPWRQLWQ